MPLPPFPSAAERHDASRRRYQARDLAGYMAAFSPDLAYRQANGEVITLQQLSARVAEQMRRMGAADWTSRVESEERGPDSVTEVVRQKGWYAATAFGFLHRLWRLDRLGRYIWKISDGHWRIVEVYVLQEDVVAAGFQLGRRPRAPAERLQPRQ